MEGRGRQGDGATMDYPSLYHAKTTQKKNAVLLKWCLFRGYVKLRVCILLTSFPPFRIPFGRNKHHGMVHHVTMACRLAATTTTSVAMAPLDFEPQKWLAKFEFFCRRWQKPLAEKYGPDSIPIGSMGLVHYLLRIFQHTPGTYPRPPTNSL